MTRRRSFDPLITDGELTELVLRMTATELAETLTAIIELGYAEPDYENQPTGWTVNEQFESQYRGFRFIETVEEFGGQQLEAEKPGHSLDSDLCLEVASRLVAHPNPQVRKYAAMFASEAYEADDLDQLLLVMTSLVKDESLGVRSQALEYFCAESNLTELPLDYFFRAIRIISPLARTTPPRALE